MRLLIMKCSIPEFWYEKKIGKTYKIINFDKTGYTTKQGYVFKEDAVVI